MRWLFLCPSPASLELGEEWGKGSMEKGGRLVEMGEAEEMGREGWGDMKGQEGRRGKWETIKIKGIEDKAWQKGNKKKGQDPLLWGEAFILGMSL